jgi:hypothetical protein
LESGFQPCCGRNFDFIENLVGRQNIARRYTALAVALPHIPEGNIEYSNKPFELLPPLFFRSNCK